MMSVSAWGMVQAWVAHFVMPNAYNPNLGLFFGSCLHTTRQAHNTQNKHRTNTTTMVVEPSTPPAALI
jgi:hypothetical protein